MKDGELELQKARGTSNVADAMTKAVDRWALAKHAEAKNRTPTPSRADKSVSRSITWRIFLNGLVSISTEGVKMPLPCPCVSKLA